MESTAHPEQTPQAKATPLAWLVDHFLPWFVSFALHALLLAAGFFIVWSVTYLRDDSPRAAIDPGEADEVVVQLTASDFLASEAVEQVSLEIEAAPPIEARPALESDLAPDLLAAPGNTVPSLLTGEGAAERTARFAGTSAKQANRIVYLLDASGSMRLRFPIVVNELMRSLDRLHAEQRFLVVLFQNDGVLTPDFVGGRPRLLEPSADNRNAIARWLDTVVAQGTSNPLATLRLASRLDPDTVFLLSNNITGAGQYEISQAALLSELERLNPKRGDRRAIVINTIQFLDEDPLDTMRLIAERHGLGEASYNFIGRVEAP
ncbi:MAG: hypothetical protein ACF8NJ_09595 [Phycisphaerales bacterium JB038]